ncbi:MAG: hypothetical protein DRG24_00260 [Epsilonproteobacteria bacterium]|nr:MAG: hypothetical protein DRG24_00260 [Campylobacterota bacterium]
MIYIHRIGGYNAVLGEVRSDIKAALKAATGKVFRRTDRYIQLSMLGAHEVAENIDADTALFMFSGEGNLSVFNRLRDQQYIDHQPPRPVDFINSLSNTAGFYVAQYLNLKGKNLFLSHHGFPAQMALILAENDLKLKKQKQILLGGVDELLEPVAYTKKFLGVCDDTVLGEGSNWLILRAEERGALASIETLPEELTREAVLDFMATLDPEIQVAFGMRTDPKDITAFTQQSRCMRFDYESSCGYYETVPFYVLSRFVEREKGQLVFIDCFEERYRVMTLYILTPGAI